jgi:hypothetical protein
MSSILLVVALSWNADPTKAAPVGLSASLAEAARLQKDRRDREAIEYLRTLQRAHDAWQVNQNRCSRELLDSVPWEPRGWEWWYVSPKK